MLAAAVETEPGEEPLLPRARGSPRRWPDLASEHEAATGVAGGPMQLHTSSGSIHASDLRAGQVSAVTSSGDIGLAFSAPPSAVTARTSSGDVDVTVPHGSQLYGVVQHTGSGEKTAAVRTDPSSTRHIDESTSSGDVSVAYR